jgi:hypothetical protein
MLIPVRRPEVAPGSGWYYQFPNTSLERQLGKMYNHALASIALRDMVHYLAFLRHGAKDTVPGLAA